MKKTRKTNTGKSSEALFDNTIASVYGIKGHVHQFYDAAYLHGLNKRPVLAPEQPSDRLVTVNGVMFYAEVKSVSKGASWPFSMIQTGQLRAAKLQLLAGGDYFFFVHDLQTDTFYVVHAKEVFDSLEAGIKSLKWSQMKAWEDYATYKSRGS